MGHEHSCCADAHIDSEGTASSAASDNPLSQPTATPTLEMAQSDKTFTIYTSTSSPRKSLKHPTQVSGNYLGIIYALTTCYVDCFDRYSSQASGSICDSNPIGVEGTLLST